MDLRKTFFAAGLLALCAAPAFAAVPKVVTLAPIDTVQVAPGHSAKATLRVTVAEGYHVQANPASADYLIPTKLALAKVKGLKLGKVHYPAPKMFTLEGTTDQMATYSGTFDITVPVKAAAGAKAGAQTVKGTLRYQSCNSQACLAPVDLPVELTVEIGAGR